MGWLEESQSVLLWEAVAQGCKAVDEVVHVPAATFLHASEILANIFDLIPGMGIAKSAMMDNILKIRKHFPTEAETDPPRTLQQAILADPRSPKEMFKDQKSVAHQLVWLSRGISFLVAIVAALEQDRGKSMTDCVRAGYEQSLKPHHPFPVQGTVYLLAKGAPARDTFLAKLSDTADTLEAAKPVFEHLKVAHEANKAFLAAKGL